MAGQSSCASAAAAGSPLGRGSVFRGADRDTKATVSFDHVKDWYVYAKDHSRKPAFELAGEDGEWHSAGIDNFRKKKNKEGKEVDTDYIDGPDIVLSCETVSSPVKVRYMGKPRTSGTLYNEAALPLGPFEMGRGEQGTGRGGE